MVTKKTSTESQPQLPPEPVVQKDQDRVGLRRTGGYSRLGGKYKKPMINNNKAGGSHALTEEQNGGVRIKKNKNDDAWDGDVIYVTDVETTGEEVADNVNRKHMGNSKIGGNESSIANNKKPEILKKIEDLVSSMSASPPPPEPGWYTSVAENYPKSEAKVPYRNDLKKKNVTAPSKYKEFPKTLFSYYSSTEDMYEALTSDTEEAVAPNPAAYTNGTVCPSTPPTPPTSASVPTGEEPQLQTHKTHSHSPNPPSPTKTPSRTLSASKSALSYLEPNFCLPESSGSSGSEMPARVDWKATKAGQKQKKQDAVGQVAQAPASSGNNNSGRGMKKEVTMNQNITITTTTVLSPNGNGSALTLGSAPAAAGSGVRVQNNLAINNGGVSKEPHVSARHYAASFVPTTGMNKEVPMNNANTKNKDVSARDQSLAFANETNKASYINSLLALSEEPSSGVLLNEAGNPSSCGSGSRQDKMHTKQSPHASPRKSKDYSVPLYQPPARRRLSKEAEAKTSPVLGKQKTTSAASSSDGKSDGSVTNRRPIRVKLATLPHAEKPSLSDARSEDEKSDVSVTKKQPIHVKLASLSPAGNFSLWSDEMCDGEKSDGSVTKKPPIHIKSAPLSPAEKSSSSSGAKSDDEKSDGLVTGGRPIHITLSPVEKSSSDEKSDGSVTKKRPIHIKPKRLSPAPAEEKSTGENAAIPGSSNTKESEEAIISEPKPLPKAEVVNSPKLEASPAPNGLGASRYATNEGGYSPTLGITAAPVAPKGPRLTKSPKIKKGNSGSGFHRGARAQHNWNGGSPEVAISAREQKRRAKNAESRKKKKGRAETLGAFPPFRQSPDNSKLASPPPPPPPKQIPSPARQPPKQVSPPPSLPPKQMASPPPPPPPPPNPTAAPEVGYYDTAPAPPSLPWPEPDNRITYTSDSSEDEFINVTEESFNPVPKPPVSPPSPPVPKKEKKRAKAAAMLASKRWGEGAMPTPAPITPKDDKFTVIYAPTFAGGEGDALPEPTPLAEIIFPIQKVWTEIQFIIMNHLITTQADHPYDIQSWLQANPELHIPRLYVGLGALHLLHSRWTFERDRYKTCQTSSGCHCAKRWRAWMKWLDPMMNLAQEAEKVRHDGGSEQEVLDARMKLRWGAVVPKYTGGWIRMPACEPAADAPKAK